MCEIMPLTGFEPRSSGDGSDRSAREHSPLGGSITVQLVFSFTSLDSADSLHTINNIFSSLVKTTLVKFTIFH